MAFWSDGSVEPKRNFRFQVQFGGGGVASQVNWWAKSVTIPAWDVAEVEHNYLDNKYYFPGRVTWGDVTLTLVDPISVDAVSITNKILTDQNYLVKNSSTKGKTISHATTPLTFIITVYDAAGATEIEKWTLNRAFIKSAKFGDLDYANDDLKTVELTIRYDWATCDTSANNLATNKGTFFTTANDTGTDTDTDADADTDE